MQQNKRYSNKLHVKPDKLHFFRYINFLQKIPTTFTVKIKLPQGTVFAAQKNTDSLVNWAMAAWHQLF